MIKKYLNDIIEILKNHNTKEIILFGSLSSGNYDDESDIDLLVVLDIDEIPETYEEKMKLKLDIRRSLRKINRKVAIDLLVYTKKEIEKMTEEKGSFFKEILDTGKKLYEKAS